jgi:hypothetical protein
MEMQIGDMEVALADKRSMLGDIVSKKLDSVTEPKVQKLTLDISKLRDDILEKRVKLNALLLQAQ